VIREGSNSGFDDLIERVLAIVDRHLVSAPLAAIPEAQVVILGPENLEIVSKEVNEA